MPLDDVLHESGSTAETTIRPSAPDLIDAEDAELMAEIAAARQKLEVSAQLADQFEHMLRDMALVLIEVDPSEIDFVRGLDLLTDDEIEAVQEATAQSLLPEQ